MKPNLERIKEIFSLAMQKKSLAERERFLADTCQGDLELRQQVESLLCAQEKAGEFLAQTVQLPPSNFVAEKPGDKIGRYKLLQQIGEGGCGVVYVADQEEPVKRRVALKVIKPGMDTREVLGRFEAERQALALMDHPNIAKVLDAGATETGRPFFVMELVRGIPITRYCDENKLNTEQRLELFVQVCHAIQHAHQKGIIHRDIKPSNVLVADHDGVPVPKVIDFGIAKATSGQTLTDKTVFTALEQFIGTPAYMSPEQAKMSGLDIDTRSDIYSLGVLLYELLTGKTPFDAKKLFEAGFDEIRRIIREEEPPRPSQKLSTLAAEEQTTTARSRQTDPPRLLHLVRGDLDWIVMKCLEKDRNRRYETANGLASDLERHINNEPVLARPPSNVYRFQKLVRRNKTAFTTAMVIAAMLVAATGISLWQAIRATQAEILATQMLNALMDSKLKPNEEIKFLEKALALSRKVNGPEHTNTITVMKGLADDYDMAGRRVEAIKLQEELVALRRKVNGPEDTDTLDAMGTLATFYCSVGCDKEATALLEKICAVDPTDTETSLTLATWQTWFGHDADYEATRRRLVQQAEGTGEASTAERATMAYCLRPSTNAALLTKALNLAKRSVELEKNGNDLPWDQLAFGLAQYRNSQYAAAERTLTVAEQKAGKDRDILGSARLFRAMSLFRQDRPEAARKLFSQAEAQIPPLPADERKPLVQGKHANRDVLICWLAYKEARSMLSESAAAKL